MPQAKPRSTNKDGSPRKPRGQRRRPFEPKPVPLLTSVNKRASVLKRWYGDDAPDAKGVSGAAQTVTPAASRYLRKVLLEQTLARIGVLQQLGNLLPEVVETVAEIFRGRNRVIINGIETITPVKADVRLAAARQIAEWARLGKEEEQKPTGDLDDLSIDQLDALIERGRAELMERAAQRNVIEQESVATPESP